VLPLPAAVLLLLRALLLQQMACLALMRLQPGRRLSLCLGLRLALPAGAALLLLLLLLLGVLPSLRALSRPACCHVPVQQAAGPA
jgi:hypothetical protein